MKRNCTFLRCVLLALSLSGTHHVMAQSSSDEAAALDERYTDASVQGMTIKYKGWIEPEVVNTKRYRDSWSVTEVNDANSRFGIQLTRPINEYMNGLAGGEVGFKSDTGNSLGMTSDSNSATMRNAYAGVGTRWGLLILGRTDNGAPSGTGFYNSIAKIVTYAHEDAGALAFTTRVFYGGAGSIMQNRESNSIAYRYDQIKNLDLRFRYVLKGNDSDYSQANNESSSKYYELGGDYKLGPVRFALGYGKAMNGGTGAASTTARMFDNKLMYGVRYSAPFGLSLYYLGVRDAYDKDASLLSQPANKGLTFKENINGHIYGISYLLMKKHLFVVNYMRRDNQLYKYQSDRAEYQFGYKYYLSTLDEFHLFYRRQEVTYPGAQSGLGGYSNTSGNDSITTQHAGTFGAAYKFRF